MNQRVRIDERVHDVSVRPGERDGSLQIDVAGRAHQIDVLNSAHGRHAVVIDGEVGTLCTARSPEGVWVWWKGRSWLVTDAEREGRRAAAKPGAKGPAGVTPPTPAVVVALLVAVGDRVEAHQKLVVITAMKMETSLVAAFAGTVKAINTKVGAKVKPGDVLVEIAPFEDRTEAKE